MDEKKMKHFVVVAVVVVVVASSNGPFPLPPRPRHILHNPRESFQYRARNQDILPSEH